MLVRPLVLHLVIPKFGWCSLAQLGLANGQLAPVGYSIQVTITHATRSDLPTGMHTRSHGSHGHDHDYDLPPWTSFHVIEG